ncbi:unnamed protein product [Clonostachys rhizophaga]|uniref:G domain-containing protein n=1 Tax=Clonostachys rhizophaga TaxID=160324 RepID=A0A9N9YW12_9HYPO|nr:unnamed protein product [Clonostachys rhizophaga]
MDLPADELVDKVALYAAFTGITEPSSNDMFFLVVGRTGSGKSTFISQCTGKNAKIGHSLQSCTRSIEVFDFHWMGRHIFLIDTPGFNDSNRSDAEILEALASGLSASYANKVRIHGIIILHPISDTRMSGSSLRSIDMIKAVCGFARYDNLAIVTTMWPRLPRHNAERDKLESRYNQLLTNDRFFGGLLRQGAEVFKYGADSSDMPTAKNIVTHLVCQALMHPITVLQIQHEIVDQHKPLSETAAGLVIGTDIFQRMADEEELVASLSTTTTTDLTYEVTEHVEKCKKEMEILEKSLGDMHREGKSRWEESKVKIDAMLDHELEKADQELLDVQSSKHRPIPLTDDFEDRYSHILSLKEKISNIRAAQERFARYKGHMINGAINGLAAGLTGGIIAAAATGLACNIM